MDLIDEYLNQVGEKKTSTLWALYSALSAATLTLTGSLPSVSFRCKVTISAVTGHSDVAGSVVVGAETLAFDAAGTKTTTTALSALPIITTSGLDCHILIEAITTGGAPIYQHTYAAFACRWMDTNKLIMNSLGAWTQAAGVIVAKEVYNVGDYIRKYGETAEHPIIKMRSALGLEGSEEFREYTI